MKIQKLISVLVLIFVMILAIYLVGETNKTSGSIFSEVYSNKNNFLVNPKSEKDLLNLQEESDYSIGYIGSVTAEAKGVFTYTSSNVISQQKTPKYSETNVQVKGIDEGDIVKTDGKYLYLSTLGKTFKILAYPPKDLKIVNKLNESGTLYLYKDKLILITYKKIKIYNKDGTLLKEIDLNGTYVDSRLNKNKLLVVVRRGFDIRPFYWNGIKIDYSKYFIPIYPINYPRTYIVSLVDLDQNNVVDALSLVGSYSQTIYVSKDNLYFAYDFQQTEDKIICGFIVENRKLFEGRIDVDKVIRICENKDFSSSSKLFELERILSSIKYNKTFQAELENLMKKYLEKHINELQSTGIAQINYENGLKLVSQVKIPGKLLNQFSMNEYKGYLRVATSIRDWRYRDYEVNNLYIIKDGRIVGKLEGFEKGERIYAVRFMEDKAYVVTYRETDPLLVIDLSNPNNPKIIGKLKIPGYSTYLHPISKNLMIGIGKEGFNVKVSLYDVSDMENPKELDKFILKEFWSPALYNHHAFLYDNVTKKLVLPAHNKFYIFKIENNKIKLLYVDEFQCNSLRSLYFDDYIYDISNNEIHVIKDQDIINKLKLSERCYYWYYPYPVGFK